MPAIIDHASSFHTCFIITPSACRSALLHPLVMSGFHVGMLVEPIWRGVRLRQALSSANLVHLKH